MNTHLSIQSLTDFEILKEIYNHASATGLPASCLGMADSKPLFASENVDRSCGVGKGEFLRVPNAEIFFPPLELADYKDRIIAAAGAVVDLPYIAANISDRQLCQRRVEVRLIKTSWGELARLCKVVQLPIPTGKVI